MAVFQKSHGFSNQYKIYYEAIDKNIYEAYVTHDKLRNRFYFINFNVIVRGVNPT